MQYVTKAQQRVFALRHLLGWGFGGAKQQLAQLLPFVKRPDENGKAGWVKTMKQSASTDQENMLLTIIALVGGNVAKYPSGVAEPVMWRVWVDGSTELAHTEIWRMDKIVAMKEFCVLNGLLPFIET